MIRKKLLIFSDCFIYSGSEVVIENLLLSAKVNAEFDVSFLYGFNRSYDQRFKERAKQLSVNLGKAKSIRLLSPEWYTYQYSLNKKQGFQKLVLLLQIIFLKLIKLSFLSHIINFARLYRAIKKSRPDLIYINNGGYPASLQCCVAVFAARAAGIKTIFFNINNMALPRAKSYEKLMDHYVGRFVTNFVTASYAAQKQAVQTRQFDQKAFRRIPNTIYNDLKVAENFQIKQRPAKLIFGSIGLLTERKGYHILLNAIKLLVEQYQFVDFEVNLIGDGEDRAMLVNLSKTLNIEKYVHFLGFKSEPLSDLNGFDVFVSPSIRNEDFPNVILEAMLLSKPVIGTNVAGIPEQILDGENGLVVNPNDPDALANAMFKIRADIDRMGVNGYNRYVDAFSFKHFELRYLNLFTSVST
jgi:glycosyltransferase involved in cell wall biosynthesis